ncbi:MAG: hypothetical protein OJF59_000809 [Cytophagales bacterium]|jgi:hypothetical protein|nr:hypothetical protein [Bacteroidota bacterium]MBS1979800.1 hypothetical protein [Bacteroidota bacterium]WHZ07056.1 MAG: hypothetical protein OJF59_000809 [Cytophagales bacterium]
MNKFFSLALIGFCVFTCHTSVAQSYAEESLIFSRIVPGGSARIQALGGAQTALGGDYSSAYSNPAGLGFYNKSEATLSLGNSFYNSSSNYLGQNTSGANSNFHVPGFSIVLHSDKNNGKLISGNFAISFNRINNFNKTFNYTGTNTNNSMIDSFIQQSDGADPSQFSAGNNSTSPGALYYTLPWLGYQNYLFGPSSEINPNGDSTLYHTYVSGIPLQKEKVQTSGAQNQWNIAYGLNFNDFFYVGGSLGIVSLNYQSAKKYTESFSSGPLNRFELDENLSVTGTGINATLGVIVKPKDFIQFGLSASSPTAYPTLTENYSATLSSSWNNYLYQDVTYPSKNTVLNSQSASMSYSTPFLYGLATPWRLRGGVTVFIEKHGFITADVEKVNYQKSSFSSNANTPYDFSQDNHSIATGLRNVFNFHAGGEYRYQKYHLRAGYSYMPDPYSQIQNGVSNAVTGYTGGLGYRTGKYFVDLGFVLTQWKSTYLPYSIYQSATALDPNSPIVNLNHSNPTVLVTFGFTL